MASSGKEFRELDQAAVRQRIVKLRQELRLAKEEVRQGKEKNNARLERLRRDIARAQTVLNEKKILRQSEGDVPSSSSSK